MGDMEWAIAFSGRIEPVELAGDETRDVVLDAAFKRFADAAHELLDERSPSASFTVASGRLELEFAVEAATRPEAMTLGLALVNMVIAAADLLPRDGVGVRFEGAETLELVPA
jgi:hypothetical protein